MIRSRGWGVPGGVPGCVLYQLGGGVLGGGGGGGV